MDWFFFVLWFCLALLILVLRDTGRFPPPRPDPLHAAGVQGGRDEPAGRPGPLHQGGPWPPSPPPPSLIPTTPPSPPRRNRAHYAMLSTRASHDQHKMLLKNPIFFPMLDGMSFLLSTSVTCTKGNI